MSYSINLYLDSSVSDKLQNQIKESDDNEAKKELEKIISQKQLQIFLYLRFEGKTLKVFTERKCTQKQWDAQKQEVNPRYFKSGSVQLNEYLNNLKTEVARLYQECVKQKTLITKDLIKSVIDEHSGKKLAEAPKITFLKAFEEYIEVSKPKTAANTIKRYFGTLNHLKGFMAHKKITLTFDSINLEFEHDFRKYLLEKKKLIDNTITKYLKTVKSFMKYCIDRDYTENRMYQKFNVKEREGEIYVLTREELLNLYQFDFQNERLAKVRDVFCFSCFTGLRFSDIVKIRWENIKDDELHITIEKTRKDTIIPLNPFALKILQKYEAESKPLPVITNQKINDYLKEIGQIVGLEEKVRIKKFVNSKITESHVPKWEVLTFHVARKTFTTLSLILGMTEAETKDITGHTDTKSFRRYVKLADSHKKKVMNRVWSEENILGDN